MNIQRLIGVTFDFEAYEQAKAVRWWKPKYAGGLTRCDKHGTLFQYNDPIQEDDEPCWQCYKEFEKEIQ